MGLKTRMALAIFSLFALLFAILMALAYWLMLQGYLSGILIVLIPVAIALFVVLLQWAIAPYIIRFIYDIRWTDPRDVDPDMAEFMERICKERNIPVPKFGIIEDDNPNAFTFGWTRRRAHVVLTRGIMKYCGPAERDAVLAHELGHISNNDFVVMTIVAAVPLLLFVIFRGSLYSLRFARGGRGRGNAAVAILAVAAVSFVAYLVSNLIALMVGRYREYYADAFSADASKDPNALSSALLTIAYGLAKEGRGEESEKKHYRYESTLMIFNSKSARALAAMSADRLGRVNKEKIKKVMAWDLWNPWAFFLELGMTHPLTAKRVVALGEKAKEIGQFPFISFDLEKTESYWDDFLKDIAARSAWLLAFPSGLLGFYYFNNIFLAAGLFLSTLGLTLALYLRLYRYPKRFREEKVENLLVDPKASPVKGRGAKLRGKIIGRGQPGLFFSEDLKLDDGTGLLLLDYHQVSRFIDLLVGIFATRERIGKEVEVEGWYRRRVIPYMEIYRMRYDGKRIKTYTAPLKFALSVLVLAVGALLTAIATGLIP
ncbi:MAG: M48 family metalloprotease [Candidatus Thermoplasmatota archaeon]|nr:M48 family metalloprotease [Candidatus Thermoplasmatota archaeon]